jgi:hypothetical protein
MELLHELPAPVGDELRLMVTALGPHATPAEMTSAARKLTPATREAVLALLVTQLREELGAVDEAPTADLSATSASPDGEVAARDASAT